MMYDHLTLTRGASATLLGDMTRRAYILADRLVVLELETQPLVAEAGRTDWIDVRPLLDEREHAPQVTDMWREVLAYAQMRQLTRSAPGAEHLVRIIRREG